MVKSQKRKQYPELEEVMAVLGWSEFLPINNDQQQSKSIPQ